MPERSVISRIRPASLAAVLLLAALPLARASGNPPSGWLNRLNAVRAQVGLRPVTAADRLEQGIANHSRYIVKTDDYQHGENRNSPYYTPSGNNAGLRSNIAVRAGGAGDEINDVEQWLAAPFHALGLLHPQLRATAYANYYESDSPGYTYAAGLDVLSIRDGRDSADYPYTFPGNGMVLPTTMVEAADEVPNPLTPCNYQAPAGLPIIVTFGPTVAAPVVTSYSLTRDGAPVEACATTAADYGDGTARAALDANHTVLVIPRAPLQPGRSYTARVTASGITETTSFSVARMPSAVYLALSKGELDCGDTVDVFALLDAGFGGSVRQTLQLWGRGTPGNKPWQLLRSVQTNAEGRATFEDVLPGGNTEYQVRYAGNQGSLPARSEPDSVDVRPLAWRVSASPYDAVFFSNEPLRLSGDAKVGGGARLTLQEQTVDGTWSTVDGMTATADHDGHYEMTVPLTPGRHVYRTAAAAAGCHRLGNSNDVRVVVVSATNG